MKKSTAYRYLILLVFVFHYTVSLAQPFTSRIYTANHGLPDAYTLGIFQDRDGYLWIGSYTGLSRFDGQRFVTVEAKNKSSALRSNVILQDHLGRLWINFDQTVCLLEKDSIIAFPTSDGRLMDYVFGAIELQDHRIWVLVDRGAYEFDEHQWKKIDFPPPFEGLNCRQVIETREGLYFNFEKYIAFRNVKGEYNILSPTDQDAFYITIQKAGNALYANRVNGMIKIENGRVTELFTDQLSQTTNYNFLIDDQRRFWISTERDGILASDPGNESHLDHTIPLPFNLSTYLFEDRDHNIWATNYEGLIKISEVAFRRYDASSGEAFTNIRCLASDQQGHVYIAVAGKGVFKLTHGAVKPEALFFNAIEGFKEDVVDGITFDGDNAMWLITRGRKLIRYKNQSASDMTALLPKSPVGFHDIEYDQKLNKVLISSEKLYIGDETGFRSWGEVFHTAEINQPWFICLRPDGSRIVNTRDEGVFLIREQREIINISGPLGISGNSKEVKVYEDPTGGIWVTNTGEGISRFAESKENVFEKIALITTRDGLPNNTIMSAVFDSKNKLWLTTLSGLATIVQTGSAGHTVFEVNRVGEELGRTVLNWGASGSNIACDREDNIWISTFHELIRFDSDKSQVVKNLPGISIENIKLNFKETDWKTYADSCTGYFSIPFNPILKHTENSLGITYRGISFSDSPGLLYSYTLSATNAYVAQDSLTTTWSEPTASNDVSFVKLPPGQYVFAVKAKEAGTSWSEPATFHFTIMSPFWMTWWFRLVSVILIASFIWGAVRIRIKHFRKKAALQNQLNELEMKALKAQMNPHFIYNALNSIQSLVMDGKQQESVKYMSKFARLLRQVLEHSGTNMVTLDKELNTIDLYVQLEMLRMNVKLDYTVRLDDQILVEKEWIPPLILQPFIENALWHGLSRKDGDKRLRLEINADDDWLYVTITDNGIGRQKAEEVKAGNVEYPRSMGMEITGKRLQLVNSENVTAMAIRDIKDAQGQAAGTEVSLKLKRQNHLLHTV